MLCLSFYNSLQGMWDNPNTLCYTQHILYSLSTTLATFILIRNDNVAKYEIANNVAHDDVRNVNTYLYILILSVGVSKMFHLYILLTLTFTIVFIPSNTSPAQLCHNCLQSNCVGSPSAHVTIQNNTTLQFLYVLFKFFSSGLWCQIIGNLMLTMVTECSLLYQQYHWEISLLL